MNVLEFISSIIGHLAWPIFFFLIFRMFKEEIVAFVRRVRVARYRDVEINLQKEIEEVKEDAELAGVTIAYPPESFPDQSIKKLDIAPEWVILQSWQEIENLISTHYKRVTGTAHNVPVIEAVSELSKNHIIDADMRQLIDRLRRTRNIIVHGRGEPLTKAEALEWLGIARSIRDRLAERLGATSASMGAK